MKALLAGIAGILLLTSMVASVDAANVPGWVKNNAKWWAEDQIDNDAFVSGVQYMIENGIINVPSTTRSSGTSDTIPAWVKNNAKWWADGTLTENEFVNALQYLIKMGIMKVSASAVSDDGESKSQYQSTPKETTKPKSSGNTNLDDMLAKCQSGENKREIRECEKVIKDEYKITTYMNEGEKYKVGNVAYYYLTNYQWDEKDFNNIAYTATGQPLLNLQILVQNTGTSNETLMCTSPSICNYSIWDGGHKWVNSGSDFTSGNIVLKPGQAKFANMLWGPAIGYGSYENFEYDSGKDYYLRIAEPFGKFDLPLNLVIAP
ncbi:MAG: peptidase [Crenarchaeota archaeon]|nr:peptidase [Thermoproteota archaeon]MDA1124575.1 peptidase [Thermoproteota archaeon]